MCMSARVTSGWDVRSKIIILKLKLRLLTVTYCINLFHSSKIFKIIFQFFQHVGGILYAWYIHWCYTFTSSHNSWQTQSTWTFQVRRALWSNVWCAIVVKVHADIVLTRILLLLLLLLLIVVVHTQEAS